MKLLFNYLKNYKGLVLLALGLATVNQIFSLLDPLVFKHIVDDYASNPTRPDFVKGVGLLILLAMGFAMISRIAKNFQDYYVNVITQKLGAQIYSDGLKHSLELPYQVFEDQRSGETLGKLTELAKAKDVYTKKELELKLLVKDASVLQANLKKFGENMSQ